MTDRTSMPQLDPSLDQVQRWLQTVIMDPDGIEAGIVSKEAHNQIAVDLEHVDDVIVRSQNQTSIERLQVYSNAYYARLLECLRSEFPALLHALGDETFDAFAFGYLQMYPSRSYTLANLGAKFPQFLTETRPNVGDESSNEAETWPDFLIDLATVERTYSEVFSSSGFENQRILQPEDVAAIPPEHISDARLIPVPCLRLLKLQYPVHEYISAVRHGNEILLPTVKPTYLVITRRDYVVRRCSVSSVEFAILADLQSGQTIEQSIEQASAHSGFSLLELELHLSDWFRQWAVSGYFQEIKCSTASNDK
tara:strand:- start:4299 stop:5225 length:927 start_codon:yes stop_codon:yes gene_type:complete